MIFGKKLLSESRSRRLVVLAVLACATATPVWANWNIDALMKQLSQHPGGSARFTETKKLSVLDTPVVSSGTLLFSPPDRLEKNTLLPKPESMVLERDRLTLVRDGKKREIRLQQYPEAMGIVEAIRSTLLGNQSVLRQHYALQLQGTEANWRLVLTPAEERTSRWITQILISGKSNQVTTVETLQADGDRSVMAIEPHK
ncbi:outer membrane lipoprotein-sorting protein [Ottowia thiooxydans]|uniref:Outer membrane lipoprotein-sorting protein n=2 Tax=Ottowia thiooxydans TaxID=219182 RepID=A0ABV2Q1P1_9BURK